MIALLSAFFSSFIATLLIIRFEHLHSRFTADSDLSGPQKFHRLSVPRVGGVSIAIGLVTAMMIRLTYAPEPVFEFILLACIVPTFGIGLLEDLSKKVSVRTRLCFTARSAILAETVLGAQIPRLDIPFVDIAFQLPIVAILFTVFAITGLSNAYNIIDGFNGLSSMVGAITLMGLGYVSYTLGDLSMMQMSFMMCASILGFFIWNYPRGLIFLGDGGAYLIGFWVAMISVLLVARHPNISPWFAVLINAYPILETLFTIYRRSIHQGKSAGQPDGIHFHSLIFRRVLNPRFNPDRNDWFSANAKTSPYLWILTSLAIIPAIFWWSSTTMMIASFALFVVSYVWLYRRIVTFKTPSWMHPYN